LTLRGQFILRKKISKLHAATRCQISRLECTKFDFRCGSAPDPAGGANSAPPDSVAVFKGRTSKGRAGKREGWGREKREGNEREGGVRGRKGGKGRGQAPIYFGLEQPLS